MSDAHGSLGSVHLGRLVSIWRYPVKSMQGESIDHALLDGAGIAGDRRLAVRDLGTGRIVSAKAPRLGRALLDCRAVHDLNGDVIVTVDGRDHRVGDDPAALDAALTAVLGRPAALVTVGNDSETYASEWPEIEGMALSGIELDLPMPPESFADVAPLHLLSTASLHHVASLLPDAVVDHRRFRPGIVVDVAGSGDGSAGFVENEWVGRPARVGAASIAIGAATPRCVMTTVAQPGLPAEPGVLRTLAAANRRDYGGFGMFACLGVYATVTAGAEIRVGDELVLTG